MHPAFEEVHRGGEQWWGEMGRRGVGGEVGRGEKKGVKEIDGEREREGDG